MHGSLEAVTESLRKLEPRRGQADVRAPRRRRHHRERHHARRHHQRHDHRLQRPPGPQGPRARRHRGRRDPHLRDHLQAARGHRAGDGRHARAGVRRGGHRRGRGPRDLPGAADRRDRRLLRALGRHHPWLQGALPARRHDHLEGRDHLAASGSRTTPARSARASSAASACPTSRTSSPATSSRPSRSARSPAPDRRPRGGRSHAPSNPPSTSSSSSTRSARGAGSPPGGSPTCRPRRTTRSAGDSSRWPCSTRTRSRHAGDARGPRRRAAGAARRRPGAHRPRQRRRRRVLHRARHADPRRPAARRARSRTRPRYVAEALERGRPRPGRSPSTSTTSPTTPYLRAEIELALSRTGPDVGTPILTFAPGQGEREGSFFGPGDP